MKESAKEFLTINFLLVFILFMLAAFTLADQNAATVSGANAAIYKVDTEEKKITIMCNVYEGSEYVSEYIALFKKYNVKATFFVGGTWVQKNPETVKALVSNGFELGNHGYAHKLPTRISKNEVREEIEKTDALIRSQVNVSMNLYAPPSGDYNKDTLSVAAGLGYTTIMWSIDTIDWRDKDVEKVSGRILNNIKPGSFILIHPTAHTLAALESVLPKLAEMGYSCVTVSDMLNLNKA